MFCAKLPTDVIVAPGQTAVAAAACLFNTSRLAIVPSADKARRATRAVIGLPIFRRTENRVLKNLRWWGVVAIPETDVSALTSVPLPLARNPISPPPMPPPPAPPSAYQTRSGIRPSLAPSNTKARQLAHLNSQLAQLQAHLADLQDIMRVTAVQAENIKALGGLNGALLISPFLIFFSPTFPSHVHACEIDPS